jgi:L-threonylcarbamoyladenylate synthase
MTKPTHRARIFRPTQRNLARLAKALRAGELVAVPTETVYGLAGNALDARACKKIFEAKGRPATDPLIIHIQNLEELETLAIVNDAALTLARAFWPGPLTMVLPKRDIVSDVLTAGRPSVAVRMPAHPLFRRFQRLARVPIAAPSANPFGYISPTTAEHVRASLGTKIRYILDGGPCAIGIESTIIDLRRPNSPQLLRPGAVTHEQLARALGVSVAAPKRSAAKSSAAQLAPGMLARHYSPRTPVVLHDEFKAADLRASGAGDAWLFMAKPTQLRGKNIFWLDARGDLRGAARRLFSMLRKLDDAGFAKIHVERANSNEGLGRAINDRLGRAAARS